MVEVATGGKGTRAIRTEYPIEEGLTAGTTKLRKEWKLKPENKSIVREIDKVGL